LTAELVAFKLGVQPNQETRMANMHQDQEVPFFRAH